MCFFVCDKFEGLVLCLMSDLESWRRPWIEMVLCKLYFSPRKFHFIYFQFLMFEIF